MTHKVHTRKKLLLREDEADVIEYALTELLNYFKVLSRLCSGVNAEEKAKTAEKDIAEIERILKLVQDAEATENGGGIITPAEVVKALRCISTPAGGKKEDCESCPFFVKAQLDTEWAEKLGTAELPSCDCDAVGLAAADLIERLEKEKAVLLETANPRKLCDICKYDSWCAFHGCNGNLCEECGSYSNCPCSKCLSHPKFEWKGLEDNDELPR